MPVSLRNLTIWDGHRTISENSIDIDGKLITKIDNALDKVEDKSYGYCKETGDPIGLGRLEARPIATLCIEAQEKHESFERQHSED